MNFATEMTVRAALALSREELGDKIRAREVNCGYSIITQARWLDPEDWDRWTIVSQDDRRIRLVALQATVPYSGAFTRLIDRIITENHVPVVVQPNAFLTLWCRRHWFRQRACGRNELRHVIWYPKRCRY
jgi:hypothetical protein